MGIKVALILTMKFLWSCLFLLISSKASAGCYREHMREAIALNRERAPLYGELTGGKSFHVSKMMIATERAMVLSSFWVNLDRWAAPFERVGIPVTCEAYMPMSSVGPFQLRFEDGPIPAEKVFPLRKLQIHKRIAQAFWTGDDLILLAVTQDVLKEMASEKRLYCMTRHLIESMARISALIPKHDRLADEKKMRSPRTIHRMALWGHMSLLERTQDIDEAALPFNRLGIPLICQDVPHIPLPH